MFYSILDIDKIPHLPGVYYFYQDDILLYIGKSLNLKNRIKHHQKTGEIIKPYVKFIENNDIETLQQNELLFYKSHINIIDAQKIHIVFDSITQIKIELLDKSLINEFEKKEIKTLKPKCNNETYQSDFINHIINKIDDVRTINLKKIWSKNSI